MIVDYKIISAKTVPGNYTWDIGTPLTGTNLTQAFFTEENAQGFSPGLKVTFKNTSIPDPLFDNITYTWNFGDYYNSTNNIISLSSNNDVEHIYVMPGKYTVTLTLYQTLLEEEFDNLANDKLCRGKYNIRWFWDDLQSNKLNDIKWDETTCFPTPSVPLNRRKPKQWANETECFEKYCKFWSWDQTSNIGGNPVTWSQSQSNNLYEKQWLFQDNNEICSIFDANFLNTINQVGPTSIIKKDIIEVVEILPTALMECLTTPITGIQEIEVELTSFKSKTGSFPIDRIDWDFGDGSPNLTISRYGNNKNKNVKRLVPQPYILDSEDVRNFSVKHTYKKEINTYPIFYPSLTCYSASTNTYSDCSIVIGPLLSKDKPSELSLIKSRNTSKGNIHIFNVDENITFLTTSATITSSLLPSLTSNVPTSLIRDSKNLPIPPYLGNLGTNYLNFFEIENF